MKCPHCLENNSSITVWKTAQLAITMTTDDDGATWEEYRPGDHAAYLADVERDATIYTHLCCGQHATLEELPQTHRDALWDAMPATARFEIH